MLMINSDIDAKIYKWVDDKGKIHYTDKPHSEQDQTIKIPNAPDKAAIKEANQRAKAIINHQNKVNEINQEMAQSKKQFDQKSRQEKNRLAKLCQNARKNAIALGRGRPIYIKNKNTEKNKPKYFLSDKEKNRKIDKLKLFISKNCQL